MLFGHLMSLAAGQLEPRAGQGGDVEMLPCSRVSVTARNPVPIQIDGDVVRHHAPRGGAGTRRGAPDPAGAAAWQHATRRVNLSLTKSANVVEAVLARAAGDGAGTQLGTSPATDECASEAPGFARTISAASERGMRRAGTAELPRVRRAWMGPPLAALGLMSPRTSRPPSRTAAPEPSKAVAGARPGPDGPGLQVFRDGAAVRSGTARPLEMEWHMKRLCHRCGVFPSRLVPDASRTLRPEPDWKWVLLWRDNQRHRPPSKR